MVGNKSNRALNKRKTLCALIIWALNLGPKGAFGVAFFGIFWPRCDKPMKTGGRGVPGFMKIPFFGNHVGPKMTGISGRFQVIDCI